MNILRRGQAKCPCPSQAFGTVSACSEPFLLEKYMKQLTGEKPAPKN
jgi:hypothetical protein